jgi:hypothetical protein
MDKTQIPASSGHAEILADGQHRWVAAPTQEVILAYERPRRQEHRLGWLLALLWFVLGVPAGVGMAMAIAAAWPAGPRSPAIVMFPGCLLVCFGGGALRHFGRTSLGWICFGATVGLFLMGGLVSLMWGFRDC